MPGDRRCSHKRWLHVKARTPVPLGSNLPVAILAGISLAVAVVVGLYTVWGGPLRDRFRSNPTGPISAVYTSQQLCDRLAPSRLQEITGDVWKPGTPWPLGDPVASGGEKLIACYAASEPAEWPRGAALDVHVGIVLTPYEARQVGDAMVDAHVKLASRGLPPPRREAVRGVGDRATWVYEVGALVVVRGNRAYDIRLRSEKLGVDGNARVRDACIEIAKLAMT